MGLGEVSRRRLLNNARHGCAHRLAATWALTAAGPAPACQPARRGRSSQDQAEQRGQGGHPHAGGGRHRGGAHAAGELGGRGAGLERTCRRQVAPCISRVLVSRRWRARGYEGGCVLFLGSANSLPCTTCNGLPTCPCSGAQMFESMTKHLFRKARLPLDQACWQVRTAGSRKPQHTACAAAPRGDQGHSHAARCDGSAAPGPASGTAGVSRCYPSSWAP